MGNPQAASFDPSTFRRELEDPSFGQVQIVQQDHGMQVRHLTELHVPCKCGRPLCGIEHEVINDNKGYALYVRGVCLKCGVQEAMYLSEPVVELKTYQTQLTARMAADVERILTDVLAVRRAALNPETDELKEAV